MLRHKHKKIVKFDQGRTNYNLIPLNKVSIFQTHKQLVCNLTITEHKANKTRQNLYFQTHKQLICNLTITEHKTRQNLHI